PLSWEEAVGPPRPYRDIAKLPVGMDDFEVFIGDTSVAQMMDLFILTSSLMVRRGSTGAGDGPGEAAVPSAVAVAGDALRFAEDVNILEDLHYFAQLSLCGKGAYLDRETTWQHGAADERISSVGSYDRAIAWNKINERVWQRDESFCTQHTALHEKALRRNEVTLARGLIAAGCSREARNLLASNPYATTADRLLSYLPNTVTSQAASFRRWLLRRGLLHG
ncbi:MAG: hypothetical protein ACC645_11735, partial [Pirellulales bacterium]